MVPTGFFRVDGWWGDHRAAARRCGSVAWIGGGPEGGVNDTPPVERAANLRRAAKRLVRRDFSLIADCELAAADIENRLTLGQTLKALRPYWGSVTHINIAGEAPGFDHAAGADRVRAKVDALGLQPRPVGAYFGPADVLNGDARLWAPLDWVGLEGYTEVPTEPFPGQSVRRKLDAMVEKIGDGHHFIIIAQAFTRNNTLTDPHKILAVNKTAGEAAEAHSADALIAFRWGQPGGIRDLPFLEEWYRARAGA